MRNRLAVIAIGFVSVVVLAAALDAVRSWRSADACEPRVRK
jgi:hypothetical protein